MICKLLRKVFGCKEEVVNVKGNRKRISLSIKETIISMDKDGYKQKEIAEVTGVSASSISRLLSKEKQKEEV